MPSPITSSSPAASILIEPALVGPRFKRFIFTPRVQPPSGSGVRCMPTGSFVTLRRTNATMHGTRSSPKMQHG